MAEGGGSVTAGVRTDTEGAKGNEEKKRKWGLFWQGTSILNGEYLSKLGLMVGATRKEMQNSEG
jgi:hypothetical protein